MTQRIDPAAPLPPYIQRINFPGTALKRTWLYALLRLTSKRTWFIDADFGALRQEQGKWDARFASIDSRVRRTSVADGDFAGERSKCPRSLPDRVILYLHGGAFMFRWPRMHTAMVDYHAAWQNSPC